MQNATDLIITATTPTQNISTNSNSTGVDVSGAIGVVRVTVAVGNNNSSALGIVLQTSDEAAANYTNVDTAGMVTGTAITAGFTNSVSNTASLQSVAIDSRMLKGYVRLNYQVASGTNAPVAALVIQRTQVD